LPYHLQLSGIGWLAVAIVFVAVTVVVFARGLRGSAIAATAADDAVVRWLNGIHLPGFVGAMRALAAISSWWVSTHWPSGCSWPCWCSGASGT
jgi:hypothetical protein